MSKSLSRILTILTAIIGVVAFYFFIRIMGEGKEAIENSAELQESLVSPYIWFAVIVLIITAALAVLGSIGGIIKHPKALKTILISLVALAVIFFIAYATASDAAVYDVSGNVLKDGEAGTTSKLVSTGITFSVILGGIGIILFLFDFVKSLVSK